MHAYQTSLHLPVAVPHAFVLIRPTTGVGTSAHAICGLILTRAASITASAGELRSTPRPMRVIAKKRCRAMFEPPEKGERATLNPNLSTRLNLLFFDQSLGRRVGYCWSRRASVPRLIFNAKTLKLCSKIKLATQAQQTAPSRLLRFIRY